MAFKKNMRFLSGVLIAAMLMSAVPVSTYAETGELLSLNDQDAASIVGWVGDSVDSRDIVFDFYNVYPICDWYQYNDVNLYGTPSPKDEGGDNEIIEYSAAYDTKTKDVGKMHKDYILSDPGYYTLTASAQTFPAYDGDKGALRIELYDDTKGEGAPIGSGYGESSGDSHWETVTVGGLSLTSKVKMIRIVLEANVTREEDANDYVSFDGLSVNLMKAAHPPIISGFSGGGTFIEDGAAIFVNSGSDAAVTVDSDFGRSYTNGFVTASFEDTGVDTEDVLSIAETGGITLSETHVLYNGTTIGTYTGGTAPSDLSISLNGSATDESVSALIKAISYQNTNTKNPNTNKRTVKVSVTDNTGAFEPVYTTINVLNVNDAPIRKSNVNEEFTIEIPFKSVFRLDLNNIFEDPDEDPLTYQVKVNEETEKTVNHNFTYTPSTAGTDTLVFRANDGKTDSTDTYTVTITAINKVPTRKSGVDEAAAKTVIVNTPYTLDLSTIFEDPDLDSLTYQVRIDGAPEEAADQNYSYTPTSVGSNTLEFLANDGIANSTDTYTVTLTVKAENTPPIRKSGVEEEAEASVKVNETYILDLSAIFEDEDMDALTYKVEINGGSEQSANENFTYIPTTEGTIPLCFTANDGKFDSTDTYTIILNVRPANTPPERKSGVEETTSDSIEAGKEYSLDLSTIFKDVDGDDLTYYVKINDGENQTADENYTFTPTAEGTDTLVFTANDGESDSTDTYTVTLTVTEKTYKELTSVRDPEPVTGIANGSAKTSAGLSLPNQVKIETAEGTYNAFVDWNVADCSYDPDEEEVQNFEVEGTVILPADVRNSSGVSLDITIDVTVDALSSTSKNLIEIMPLTAVTGIENGTEKTAGALGLPSKVILVTDDGKVPAQVNWDVESSSYDPDSPEEQSFTIDGTALLPFSVLNPDNCSLDVSIEVTVLEAETETEEEYYTLRIKVTKRPDKVSYIQGEDLDPEGLEVVEYEKASPSNAVRKARLSENDYDLEYDLTRTGTRHVKVVYYGTDKAGNEKEFTDVFTVRVKALVIDTDDDDDDDEEIGKPAKKTGDGDNDQYYSGSWQEDGNGWKMAGSDGSRPINRWVYTDWQGTNSWYFFDENGYMITGWFEYKGNVYYLNPVSEGTKGKMVTGWNQIDGIWYYFSEAEGDTKGSVLKNTTTPDGFRVGPDGARIN